MTQAAIGSEARTDVDRPASAGIRRPVTSLARRQVWVTLFAAILAGIALSGVHLVQDIRQEALRMVAVGDAATALVEPAAARAAFTYDRALAVTVVESALGLGAVLEVELSDNLGRVLADGSAPPREAPLRWLTDLLFGPEIEYRRVLVGPSGFAPQSRPGDHVGDLVIVFDTRALAGDLLVRSGWLFGLGLVKTLILAPILATVFFMLVTKPLARLAADVDRIDPEADEGVRVSPGHEADELGSLSGAINRLLRRFRGADAARLAAHRQFLTAARNMPDGLAVVDGDSRLTYFNNQFVANSPASMRPGLAVGEHLDRLLDREAAAGTLAADQGEADVAALCRPGADTLLRVADGRAILFRCSPIPGGGAVVLTGDVTQRRRVAEELRRAEKLTAVGTLASGVAHDFNNLLATIFSSAEVAKAQLPDASPAEAALNRVLAAGTRGRELVEQVLVFSRSEHEDAGPLDLVEAVREAVDLAAAPLADTIHVRLTLDATPVTIAANDIQVHQIVGNLVANAAQAMPAGGDIHVTVARDRGEAVLTVADTGPGMDEATRRRAFEPFYTTKAVGEGSGLGLAVVYGVTKSIGGVIDVDAPAGGGTLFTLRIPLIAADSQA